MVDLDEVRAWLTLLFAAAAATLALRGHLANQRQRRLENSLKLVELFRQGLRPGDLIAWEELFHASSEPAGPSPGKFVSVTDRGARCETPFSDLFSEGPPDDGAVERMADMFELLATEAFNGTIDLRLVYFQLGQLMDSVHEWVASITAVDGTGRFIDDYYPMYSKLYRQARIDANWAKKNYAHIA